MTVATPIYCCRRRHCMIATSTDTHFNARQCHLTWSVTEASRQRLDAFDQWCLNRILRVPCTAHVTNVSVRSQTEQPPVSSLIQQRRPKLFGHIARAAASGDHSRALRASIDRLPVDWRRPRGRPRQSWLRTIDSDLKPLNLGLGFH